MIENGESVVLVRYSPRDAERQFDVFRAVTDGKDYEIVEDLYTEMENRVAVYHTAVQAAIQRDTRVLYTDGFEFQGAETLHPLWHWKDFSDHCEDCKQYTEEIKTVYALQQ